MGPVTAGLCFLPMSVAAFITAAMSGRVLAGRVTARTQIGVGLLLIAAGAAAQMAGGGGSSWTVLVPGLVVPGVGGGLGTPMLVSTAVAAGRDQRAREADGGGGQAPERGGGAGAA